MGREERRSEPRIRGFPPTVRAPSYPADPGRGLQQAGAPQACPTRLRPVSTRTQTWDCEIFFEKANFNFPILNPEGCFVK